MTYTAQELNRRVQLQRSTPVIDPSTGYDHDEWATFAEVFAKVEPLVGREYLAAAAMQSEGITKFTMRYRDDLLPTDRLLFDGKEWNVQSIQNVRSGNRELLIYAKALT